MWDPQIEVFQVFNQILGEFLESLPAGGDE